MLEGQKVGSFNFKTSLHPSMQHHKASPVIDAAFYMEAVAMIAFVALIDSQLLPIL